MLSTLRLLRISLLALLGLCGMILVLRGWVGPFNLLVPVRSPLNLECFFGLCATLLIVFFGKPSVGLVKD